MKVYISATLRNFFERNSDLDVPKSTINDILTYLTDEYVESKKILFDTDGNLRGFVQIFVGEDNWTDKELWNKEIDNNSIPSIPIIS